MTSTSSIKELVQFTEQNYLIRDEDLLQLHGSDVLHERFLSIVELSKCDPSNLTTQISNVGFGIYGLKVFTHSWCRRLIRELDQLQVWASENNVKIRRPNSMNKRGVILGDLCGFGAFFDELVKFYITPIAKILFPLILADKMDVLDSNHTFTVEYISGGGEGDTKLGFHVDDAEITINICLGEEFKRGNVYFHGQRCDKHLDIRPFNERYKSSNDSGDEDELVSEVTEFEHVIGEGIIHAGKNRHGARPVMHGRRTNLIIWCRSSSFRQRANEIHDSNERNGAADVVCPKWCAVHAEQNEGNWKNAYNNGLS